MVLTLPEPARPPAVATARILALVSAALSAGVTAMFVRDYLGWKDVAARAAVQFGAPRASVEETVASHHFDDGFCVVAFAVMAVLLLLTALAAGRSSGARAGASVLAGFQAVCCGGILAWLNVGISMIGTTTADPYSDLTIKLDYAAQPAWVKAFVPISALILPALGIAALVLWLVPSSNRYYRALKHPAPAPLPFIPTPGFAPPPGYGSPYPPDHPPLR